jgi:hypothetical protein
MLIGKKFNELTVEEYVFYINNYKNYSDFNTLGLYRSLFENEKLTLSEKIEIRECAHSIFKKTFDFLQLKDPKVFVDVSTLGLELTKADVSKIWDDIRNNQQKILTDKKIKHRNFGTYSKHICPYEDCIYQGLMVRPGSRLAETNIHFASDTNNYFQIIKAEKRKSDRKTQKLLINKELNER